MLCLRVFWQARLAPYPLHHSTHLVETRLLVELVFETYAFSMELQSFKKPYGTLLNSSNCVTGGPIPKIFYMPDLKNLGQR